MLRCKHLLNCIDIGQKEYEEFVKTRFKDKDKRLFDPIPKIIKKTKKIKAVIIDTQRESSKTQHFINIARARGYDIDNS